MGSLRNRIERLRRSAHAGGPAGPHVILIDRSGKHPPGLHRAGPPGSLAAVWSLGPDESDETPPAGVPPFALIIGGEIGPDAI